MKTLKEQIAERAYEIWEWRMENDQPGDALSDWLEAEEEIIEKYRGVGCMRKY